MARLMGSFAKKAALWAAIASAASALLQGCGSSEKRTPRDPDRVIIKDTPSALRDCVLAQATLRGIEPILVSGYGLVVGLNDTGGGDAPGPVRASMEREMLIMGVGREIGPFKDLSPNDILNDKRTSVVVVSAAIPPGAPVGTKFDVRVEALPGTATTSLEGGRLYTTRLFRGVVRPAMPATEPLAEARGELFINPFADPANAGSDSVYRTVGRVLNGGEMRKPLPVTLTLDTPSHARARAITEAINSRFPPQRGDKPVARGLNEETIEITVPAAFRDKAEQFFNLLQHVRVDRTFPEEAAKSYVKALQEQPEISESLSQALEALGPVAIPHLRRMYDYPEIRPRTAALTAGARLGDLTTRPHLEEIARNGAPSVRPGALALLGNLPADPKVNEFLRDQLSAPELDIRLAAYEALVERRDPWISRSRISGKFVVDAVPSAEPMVYAALQREPKIVVFGEALALRRPVFVSVWDDRLMVSAEQPSDPIRLFYRDFRTGRSVQGDVRPAFTELIEYMAHKSTPESPAPGLDLTYSEVVGAIAAMLAKGAAAAPFVPETDRLELALIRARQSDQGEERPELAEDETTEFGGVEIPSEPGAEVAAGSESDSAAPAPSEPETSAPAAPAKRSLVVPLPPATPPSGTKKAGKGAGGG